MNFTLFRIANFIVILINPNITIQQRESILTLLAPFLPTAKVAFCDLAPTNAIYEFIEALSSRYQIVSFKDHHKDLKRNKNDMCNFNNLCNIIPAPKFYYETRDQYPACASMMAPGEYVTNDVQIIFAHEDFDGIMSAFIGCYHSYPGIVADAEIMDGYTAGRKMTEFGSMVQYALNVVPYYSIKPHEHHYIRSIYCQKISDWLAEKLSESSKEDFKEEIFDKVECSKANAKQVAKSAELFAPGLVYADALTLINSGEIIDWDFLNRTLSEKYESKVSVIATSGLGHKGEQVFLRVVKGCKIDLRNYITVTAHIPQKGIVELSKWQDFVDEWNTKR